MEWTRYNSMQEVDLEAPLRRGLRATRPIPKGHAVVEYLGRQLDSNKLERRLAQRDLAENFLQQLRYRGQSF